MEKQKKSAARAAAVSALTAAAVYACLIALLSLLIVRGTAGEGRGQAVATILAAPAAYLGSAFGARFGAEKNARLIGTALFMVSVLFAGFLAYGSLSLPRATALCASAAVGSACDATARGKKKRARARRTRR